MLKMKFRTPEERDEYFRLAESGASNPNSGNSIMNELLGAALGASGAASRPLQAGEDYAYYKAPGMGRPSTRHADAGSGMMVTGTFQGTPNAEGMYMHPFDPSKWHLRNIAPLGMFGPNTAEREEMNKQYYRYPGRGR